MRICDIEIRYPHQVNDIDAERYSGLDPQTILAHFDALNLRKYQVQQLQLDGPSLSFSVTDPETQQMLKLILNAYAEGDEYQFRLDSNIEAVIPHKNVFGLLTVNAKYRVQLKQIPVALAREYLNYFVQGQVEQIKAYYTIQHNTPKASKV